MRSIEVSETLGIEAAVTAHAQVAPVALAIADRLARPDAGELKQFLRVGVPGEQRFGRAPIAIEVGGPGAASSPAAAVVRASQALEDRDVSVASNRTKIEVRVHAGSITDVPRAWKDVNGALEQNDAPKDQVNIYIDRGTDSGLKTSLDDTPERILGMLPGVARARAAGIDAMHWVRRAWNATATRG